MTDIDQRQPPFDVMGALADHQVRRQQLQMIAEHVAEKWPEVRSVRCRFSDDLPLFSIHIERFSEAGQRRHWPLGDWIEAHLEGVKCRFLFLPALDKAEHFADIEIYSARANRRNKHGRNI